MKKEDKRDLTKLSVLAGSGAVGTGLVLGNKDRLRKYIENKDDRLASSFQPVSHETPELMKKLRDVAKKQGTEIRNTNDKFNSYYVRDSRWIYGDNRPRVKDLVNVEAGVKNKAAILAHELGHSKHYYGRDGSKIGKLAHKLMDKQFDLDVKTGLSYDSVQHGLGVIGGFASGIKAGRDKKKGKKESILNKVGYTAVPIAYHTPTLVSEFEASRQGLKMLKKAGASKAYQGLARKNLGVYLGSYVSRLATPILAGYGARQVGKIIGRRTVKDNKDHEK